MDKNRKHTAFVTEEDIVRNQIQIELLRTDVGEVATKAAENAKNITENRGRIDENSDQIEENNNDHNESLGQIKDVLLPPVGSIIGKYYFVTQKETRFTALEQNSILLRLGSKTQQVRRSCCC